MPSPRPVLGFPSVRDAVVALHAQRLDADAIADRVGTTVNSVRVTLNKAGVSPRPRAVPLPGQVASRNVELNEVILRGLREHAVRREMQTQTLAVLILETVIEAGLIDAVLDDREG